VTQSQDPWTNFVKSMLKRKKKIRKEKLKLVLLRRDLKKKSQD
jgi:hypothetical protein